MKNSRFTVATHILTVLSLIDQIFPGEPVKSHQIAESVNTNPIIIRRILGKLRKVGLVEVQGGATGGTRLARDPDQISLLDVYLAIEEDELFAMHPNVPSETCPVGSTIKPILAEVYSEVDDAVEGVLKDMTIGDMFRKTRARYTESNNITVEQMREMGQQYFAS